MLHHNRRKRSFPVRLDGNPFNLIETDRVVCSIAEFCGPDRLVGCYALGVLERALIQPVGCDSRGSKRVAVDWRRDVGVTSSTLRHPRRRE